MALLVVWLVWSPPSPDLAAQVYRVHLFSTNGFTLWDNNWFGGHYLPNYSLLFPALASLIGLRWTGVAAAIISTSIFRTLARERFGAKAPLASSLFALSAAGDLFIGRITFALGVSCGLASVLALVRGRRLSAGVLSLACAAASPIAAAFLVLAACAEVTSSWRVTRAAILALPALSLTLILLLLFPEGGYEPFALSSLLAAGGATFTLMVLAPTHERLLRRGAQLYLLALLLSYLLPTPMGSNAVRFGVLFVPATLAGCVRISDLQRTLARLAGWWSQGKGRRRSFLVMVSAGRAAAWLAGAIGVVLVLWQITGPLEQSIGASLEDSSRYSFYVPVIRYLDAQRHDRPMRIEVPFTHSHWDATFLGERFDLARGWERQLDTKYDALFYEGNLTASSYRAWLLDGGVRYVVLSDAQMDFSSVQEAALVRSGLPFLREVFHTSNWRVYEVLDARPLASGPGRLETLEDGGFTMLATGAGRFLVRVHYTPYWRVSHGAASIDQAANGWTEVTARRPGRIVIDAEFSLRI